MIKNNAYYEFFASYTVPNSDEVGYWVDLGANSKGKIIKVYNQNTKQWVKVTDATSEDAVSPFIGSNGNWWVDNRDTGIPAAGKNPYIGDNGNWWVYDALANDYIDTGIVAKGRSAYELAVENGFIGDEKEWLESLKEPAKQAAEEALKAAEAANEAADRIESSVELVEQAVEDAQQAVADAEEVTTNPPKIVDGYWYAYNFETKEYENTNIRANGKSFKIAKTYTSVAAMEADYNTADVEVGEFVWINTGNVEDPDDSKLYLKGETTWELVGDLSGQQGIEGQSAYEIAVQHGFSGTEEEWLQSLKQPALDAAQEALDAKTQVESTEQAIQEAEESRVSAESARVTAENTRVASEGIRESNEAARRSNEAIREQQEADRQTNTEAAINAAETATNAANQAATNANTQADRAEEYADNPPKIETNYWYLWDETTHAYVNTNVPATGEPGKSPKIQDGTWWVYDNESGDYVNTGISVSSYELTKEKVENVLTGNITTHTHDQYLTDAPSDGNQYVRQDGNWAAVDIPEVDLSNYLSKDNTTEYTPTEDYNPATKKYVDDSINSIEYTLPTASADTLGGIKVGAGLAINSETGVLSATGGGVADAVDWNNITSKPTFATVATSGSYNDLTDKPTIPDLSEVNDAVAANTEAIRANTTAIQSKVDKVEGKQLSTEDYTTEEKTKLSGIAAGAEVNVNADWNATEGDAQILNKPDLTKANNLPTWVFDASNLSTEEGDDYITVHGNKKNLETGETSGIGSTIHIATSEHIGYMSPADKTKLDELAANSITSTEVDQKINSAIASVYRVKGSVANYESLPTTDVVVGDVWNLKDTGANYVATSTTPTWDKLSETVDLSGYLTKAEASSTYQPKGNYITSIPDEYITETELTGKNYATKSEIPTNVSQLANDSGYLTAIPDEYVTESELTSKNYATKGELPTKVSELTNDSGYITSVPEEYVTSTELEDYDYATSTDVDELKQNVLTKDNTTSYSPTSDYHPATKKYIDDNMVNVVKDAAYVHTDNNYSNEEKQKVTDSLRLKEYTDVSNISSLPATHYNMRYTYNSNRPKAINFASVSSVAEMQEFYLSIKNNTGSTITQPIPNGSGWQSDETSIEIEAGKTAGVSIKKEHGIMVVRV